LTLPEPQNAVEQSALEIYLDSYESKFGFRPEVQFDSLKPTEEHDEMAAAAQPSEFRPARTAHRFLEGIAEQCGMFIQYLSDFIAPPPPPTREQVKIAAKVADERAQERADIDAWQAQEAEYDWREMQIARNEQAEDLALGDLYGVPATREGTHIARMHAQGREDEYERD
jgi:hypothetical protein